MTGDYVAEDYWEARFGKLTRVSWTCFWNEADTAQLQLTEDILTRKHFEDNVACVHDSIEVSKAEFVQAAGRLSLPAFFCHAEGGGRSWSATVGGQGDKWTNKVIAPQGTYITAWRVGLSRTTCQCGGRVFDISVVVSLSGQTSNGTWLRELSSEATAHEHHLIQEHGGFTELSGRSGGFVTQFLGHGDDSDPRWDLTSPPQLPQPCKVVGCQLRFDKGGHAVGGARFQFANVASTEVALNEVQMVRVPDKWSIDGSSIDIDSSQFGLDGCAKLYQKYKPKVLLLVVKDTECSVLRSQLRPPMEGNVAAQRMFKCTVTNKCIYWLGRLGDQNCVMMWATQQGPLNMQAAINDAVHVWHPELVLNVGFGWGAGPEEGDLGQKLGDVMVAFVVHQLSENDVVKDGDTHTREAPGQVGVWLRNIVRATRLDWYSDVQPNPAWYPKGQITGRETTKYRAFEGDVISVGQLFKDAAYKRKILRSYHKQSIRPIGGDMEGSGLHQACRYADVRDWTFVKGICDWGDEHKGNQFQELAMYNAVKLVESMLKTPGLFKPEPVATSEAIATPEPIATPDKPTQPRHHVLEDQSTAFRKLELQGQEESSVRNPPHTQPEHVNQDQNQVKAYIRAGLEILIDLLKSLLRWI